MMENKEMIYTAIYQTSQGHFSYETYHGTMNRHDAWIDAASKGGANNKCLMALVPGVHPVYFYADFVNAVSDDPLQADEMKQHDVYELN